VNFESSASAKLPHLSAHDVLPVSSAVAKVISPPSPPPTFSATPSQRAPIAQVLVVAFATCLKAVGGGGRSRRRRAPVNPVKLPDEMQSQSEVESTPSDKLPVAQRASVETSNLSWTQKLQRDIAIANGSRAEQIDLAPDAFVAFELRPAGGSVFAAQRGNLSQGGKNATSKKRRIRIRLMPQGDPQQRVSLLFAPGDEFDSDVNELTFDLQTLLYHVSMLMRRRAFERQFDARSLASGDALNPIPSAEGPYIDDDSIVIRRHCALPCDAKDGRELNARCYCWHLARYVSMIT
jgi:hypothetical protein